MLVNCRLQQLWGQGCEGAGREINPIAGARVKRMQKDDRTTTAEGHQILLTLDGVPRSQWAFAINTEPQTIGRSQFCAIRVGDPTVSREHAVVWLSEGVPHIRDMHSINGTRVNGKRIQETTLVLGDEVQLGQVILRVTVPSRLDPMHEASVQFSPTHPVTLVNPAALAVAELGPTSPEESAMREELAALYSLGGTLALCSGRSEALRRTLEWMREWLAVDQAVIVVEVDGRLRATARSTNQSLTTPRAIHWPTVKASLKQQQLVSHAVSGGGDTSSEGWPGDSPHQVVAACIPGAVPSGVIYGAWIGSDSLWDKQCREMIAAAARVLGQALVRMEGGKTLPEQDPGASWIGAVSPAILIGGPAMDSVQEFVRHAAEVDATVLITGETGTGKELVARAIHQQSARSRAPFVSRNCGAFPESLMENELFGHEPGAFTGAVKLQTGVFDEADRGTLFLDEIGELPLAQQTKILNVIEELSFQRVGGQRPVKVNVRILAATNRNLAQAVAAGQFRRDLYYRLEVLAIHLPPLRERPGDVRPLAEYFLGLACERLGLPVTQLTAEALRRLESHNWPGNVRELRNTIDRAVILNRGASSIRPEHIVITQSPEPLTVLQPGSARLADVERIHILQVLASVGGNKAKAAAMLGIDRSTLIRKLQRLQGTPSPDRPVEAQESEVSH